MDDDDDDPLGYNHLQKETQPATHMPAFTLLYCTNIIINFVRLDETIIR